MEKEPVQPNLYEISQQKKLLRETLSEKRGRGGIEEIIKEELASIKESLQGSVKEAGGLSAAKKLLKKEEKEAVGKSLWLDEPSIEKEIGPDYRIIAEFSDKLTALTDDETILLRNAQTDAPSKALYQRLRGGITEAKTTLSESLKKTEIENQTAFRAHELISYKKGLHQEGHIAPTPSVRESLLEIGTRMISGKPMFLHGPTGTGKTSLARFAAKHFTGQDAEMVYCTPQTRESSIWGKTGIRPAEGGAIQTVDIYGPLAKAMQEGKTVIFDEFTALPKEQMVFVKGVFNAKVGDKVNIVGNGKTEISSGFQMIFTANLKSEKNPERQELPPEIAREFEQNNLKIEYTPKDEAYDIMLARLMEKDGSVTLSYHDLNQTLPKFAEAITEIQIAYTDKESDDIARLTGTKDASGKTQGLKKLVLTQGTVENILDGWNIEKETKKGAISFVQFLDSRLKRALTFEEYPEKDRILATKILASKGFLRTLSAKDLNLPQAVFDVDAIKKLRGADAISELLENSKDEKHISLKELTEFDPFGKRQKKASLAAGAFLAKTKKETVGSVKFEDPIAEQIERAVEILGKREVFGPEDIKNIWEVELAPEEIPAIPFSLAELERAKELGQYLILRIDKTARGKPLTMREMNKIQEEGFSNAGGGKILYDSSWYKNEDFYTKETPRFSWGLVSKDVISGSTNKNYLEQTEEIADYLRNDVYKNITIPNEYQEAIEEFENKKSTIKKIISSDWKKAAEELGDLKITELTRQTPAEILYDGVSYFLKNKEKLLEKNYTWTSRRDSDGELVYVGRADSGGADVGGWVPGYSNSVVGVSFSRIL